MENHSEISGYAASTLVLFTFVAKDMRLLRTIAIFSNLAFITYGTIEWLPPVLFLHLVLLPLNIVRLAGVVRATPSTSDLPQPDDVMGVQTLGADMTCRPWPIAEDSAPRLAKKDYSPDHYRSVGSDRRRWFRRHDPQHRCVGRPA